MANESGGVTQPATGGTAECADLQAQLNDTLQQLNVVQPRRAELLSQLNAIQAQINSLETQINSLETQAASLQRQMVALNCP